MSSATVSSNLKIGYSRIISGTSKYMRVPPINKLYQTGI
jgi:hypothetical protein